MQHNRTLNAGEHMKWSFSKVGDNGLVESSLAQLLRLWNHSHTISECKPQGVRVKNSQYYNTLDWNLSSPDTNGAEESGETMAW